MDTQALRERLAAIEHERLLCSKCGVDKPVLDFAPRLDRPRGYESECRECKRARVNAANAARRAAGIGRTPEQKHYNNEWQKRRWANATPEQRRHRIDGNRARYRSLRAEVIQAYGGKCVCCGESQDAFLTLDHVENDGKAHRMELGAGQGSASDRLYRWARNNGFPERLQLLCWNCNLAKQHLGTCPHQEATHE